MNPRKRLVIVAMVAGTAALPLVGAGVASADDLAQAISTGQATVENAMASFNDAANAAQGDKRPQGADGTETRFFDPDPRFVEGPAGGLVKNGPFK